MMILSLVAMTGLEKCCITSAYLQWLFHSGERDVAHGPLVGFYQQLSSMPVQHQLKIHNDRVQI